MNNTYICNVSYYFGRHFFWHTFLSFFFAFCILTSKHPSHAQTSSSLFSFTPSNDLPRYFIDVLFGSLLLFSWVFYWCLTGHFIDIFPDISISVSPVFYWYSIWYSYWHFSWIFIGAFPGIFWYLTNLWIFSCCSVCV